MKRMAEDKAERVLSIYSRLKRGGIIYKARESTLYGVASRTIQRDIADIQCFLQNQSNETGEIQEVVFDRESGGYRLETKVRNQLEPKELLAICKVLLESRSMVKEEMFPILNKMLNDCGGEEERKKVKDFIGNEMHHYTELHHGKRLVDSIWVLENAVQEQRCIKIQYKKVKNSEVVVRKLKPVGVMFSEFYFYLTACIVDIDRTIEFQNPEDFFPTIYRVDRIENIKVLEEHFSVPYADRFEEGEFRKRIQFMYGGVLKKIRFKYKGTNIEVVLDKLPTAVVESAGEYGYIVRAEVFGEGIDMWLRSQGDYIEWMEVLK